MGLYYILDLIITLSEVAGLYLIYIHLCKTPRFSSAFWKFLPVCTNFCIAWMTTWLTSLGAYKLFLTAVIYFVCLKIIYKDSISQGIVCYELFLLLVTHLPEIISIPCIQWLYGDAALVEVDEVNMLRWETYVFTLIIRAFVLIGIYMLVRDWQYRFGGKDTLVVSLSFSIALALNLLSSYAYLNLGILSDLAVYMFSIFLTVSFIVSFLYSKNTMYIREQELKNRQTIERMNQQFSYYQEKAEDEKRVRALYHDMKNHLLILERQNSAETKQMVSDLRRQISYYEDYIHTGNDFLDVIIRDKVKRAKEQGIDFLAMIHFGVGDFIEPMDISAIFGNALDNAIEASVKLPLEQRLITVKADCVREMLSIVFENNCQRGESGYENTTKSDCFLHGFGIQNMKTAVEKYGGQCLIQQKLGRFTVKIILPLPEEKCAVKVKN